MLAYVCVSAATIANWQALWGGRAARAWEQNLETGLARLHRAGINATVADNFVPGYMIQTSYVPWSYLSFVIPEYGGQVTTNGPFTSQLFVVDSAGLLRRARLARVWATFRLRSRCGGGVGAGPLQIARMIRARLDSAAGPYYLLITYSSAGIAHLPLFVSDGSGYPGVPDRLVDISQGTGRSIAWLGAGAPRGLILTAAPYVCLRELAVVTLATG